MNELAKLALDRRFPCLDMGTRTMTSANKRWLLLAVLVIATLLPIYLAGRSGLRPDELFSLAMATGHSLEHPAAVANPSLGDFVEPDQTSTGRGISAIICGTTVPPASPARVVRAVLLSDTNPPLYYLLLVRMDSVFRDERYGASVIFDGMFARLSASPRHDRAAYRWYGSSACGLRSFCLLTADDLLFGRRSHVLAPVAVPACDYLDFARNATTRRRSRSLRALDPDFGRWIFDPLFLRVSMVGDCCISSRQAGKAQATSSGGMCARDGSANSAVVRQVA